MIPYSSVMRGNPQHEEDPKKAYATNQVVEVLPLEKFAEHISSHGSKYDEADITAVAILITNCLVENLLEGKKVKLGKLGDFGISLTSKGAVTAKEFTAENITGVNLVFTPGPAFDNLIKKAVFTPVATRAAQAAALAAQKEGQTTADWTPKPEEGEGEGSGEGSEGNDEP